MKNLKKLTTNTAHSIKSSVALSYVPVLLHQLDADGREMLADVLQAVRDDGYDDGYEDGRSFEATRNTGPKAGGK